MPSLDEQFQAAVWIIQALPKEGPIKPKIDDMLSMYALYKQATIGKCNTTQPYIFQVQERLKWNAWNELGDMEPDEAKARYVDKMLKFVDDAEREHDLMSYINDPTVKNLVAKQDDFRHNFAILGRTNMRGHEGETVKIHGVEVQL